MVQCQMLSRSTGCYRKTGVAGGFYPPLRFRLMGRSVGADRIRPNVMGLSRSLNGAMSDVAPFNRDIPLSGGAGDTSRYPKRQSPSLPFGMPAMPQPWRCIMRGLFPSLGKPDWGKFYVVRLLGGFTGSCGELHGNALSIDRGLRCCSVRLNTAELNGNVKILCLEVVGEQLVVFALKPNINLNYFSFRSIGRNLGIFANQC